MTSVWLLLITMASVGFVAVFVFTSAAKRYIPKTQSRDSWFLFKHHDLKHYDRRQNNKPIYYPFTDSEDNLVIANRRACTDRRHIP